MSSPRGPELREFPGTPIGMAPPFGKLPIPLPYIVGSLWEAYGSLMGKGYHFWGHLEIPLTEGQGITRSQCLSYVHWSVGIS